MKKIIMGLAFSIICFSGFAKEVEATFNACGAESIATIVDEIMLNLCAGDYAIEDLCWEGGTHIIYVTLDYDAPNSSCANPPIPE